MIIISMGSRLGLESHLMTFFIPNKGILISIEKWQSSSMLNVLLFHGEHWRLICQDEHNILTFSTCQISSMLNLTFSSFYPIILGNTIQMQCQKE